MQLNELHIVVHIYVWTQGCLWRPSPAPSPNMHDFHGQWIWQTKVLSKVKIFAWLYFKDQLRTKANLLHKHVMDDAICRRGNHPVEDRHHVFFNCPLNVELWNCISLTSLTKTYDIDILASPSTPGTDLATWLSVLLTILWRLWDARNGTTFRNERHSARNVASRICYHLTIWEGRFASSSMIPSLRQWCVFFRSCVITQPWVDTELGL